MSDDSLGPDGDSRGEDVPAGDGPSSDRSGNQLSTDVVFRLLSDRRRRSAITVLRRHGTAMSLADLADEVAVREHDAPITEIPADDVKRVYMSLYHSHVPRLEDFGVIDYRQESDMVTLSDDVSAFEPYLELAAESGSV